jgi:hypothetical protein
MAIATGLVGEGTYRLGRNSGKGGGEEFARKVSLWSSWVAIGIGAGWTVLGLR